LDICSSAHCHPVPFMRNVSAVSSWVMRQPRIHSTPVTTAGRFGSCSGRNWPRIMVHAFADATSASISRRSWSSAATCEGCLARGGGGSDCGGDFFSRVQLARPHSEATSHAVARFIPRIGATQGPSRATALASRNGDDARRQSPSGGVRCCHTVTGDLEVGHPCEPRTRQSWDVTAQVVPSVARSRAPALGP
jgi:hypothetical protein